MRDRAHLSAGDTGVAGVLCEAEPAFDAPRHRAADMTGDAFDLGIIEAVDRDLVIRAKPMKPGADLPGATPLGAAPYPYDKDEHEKNHQAYQDDCEFLHD